MKKSTVFLGALALALALAGLSSSGPASAAPAVGNQIVVRAQDVQNGQVIVDSATAAQDGWLLIRSDASGRPGTVMGFVPVHKGVNTRLVVDINSTDRNGHDLITPTLWATLVADPNALTPFARPDETIGQLASAIAVRFASSTAVAVVTPAVAGTNRITIRAQDTNSGQVIVDSVTAAQDGWLLIRNNRNGAPDIVIGFAPVHRGVNTRLIVDINPVKPSGRKLITPTLWATLVPDRNALTPFATPGEGIESRGSTVAVPFASTLTGGTAARPSAGTNQISVRAQDTNSGQVIVDSATAAQDGWLFIRSDADGVPGKVIGYVPVHKGVNTRLGIDINPVDEDGNDLITPTLWATLVADPNALTPFATPGEGAEHLPSLAVVAFGSNQ